MRRKRRRRSETRLLEAHVVSMRIKKRLLSASERKPFFVVKEICTNIFTKTLNNFLSSSYKRYEDAQKKKKWKRRTRRKKRRGKELERCCRGTRRCG